MRLSLRAALAAIAVVCVCCCFPAAVRAQYTTVSGSYVGGTSAPAASATIYWQPQSGPGAGVGAARIGSAGGQILGVAQQATVTSGAFSITLPDALASTPNICYAVTAIDNVSGQVLLGAGMNGANINPGGPYGCVQPTGSTWDFDGYVPNASSTVPSPTGGTVTGPTTFNAGVTMSSTLAGNSASFSGPVTSGTSVSTPQVNGFLYANQYATGGNGTPSNPYTSPSGTGGIQEAINALPVTTGNASSRTVYIPSGYYLITNTITITNPVNLVGAGWDSVLYVSSSLNSSTDVIHVAPASGGEIKALRLFDFAIEPQSGTPGRYGINLDGTNGEILWGKIDHIEVLQLGSSAIYASGSGSAQGTPVLTRIEDSTLDGGISCTSCGDSVTIAHNQLTGTGSNNFDMINGATGFIFEENNVTIAGGTHFGGSVQVTAPKILNNEFETLSGFTGSNGAVLDLDGPVVGGDITGNSFAVVNSITANGLRLNNATGVSVSANHFERGAGSSYDIIATSASANNTIGSNYWFSGQPFSSMFNNSGNGNYWVFGFGGNGLVLANGVPIRGITPSGTMENLELLDSSGIVWHYGYGGTAQIQSLSGPTYWGENPNNGQYAAGSGPLNYATGQTPTLIAGANSYWGVYNLVIANMLFSRTAPTISSGFGTGAFVQQSNGTADFEINVGTGGTASSGVIGLPQAAQAWDCTCKDPTTISSTVWDTRQTASTTTSCTVTNYSTSAAVAPWASGDNIVCRATAR